MATTTHHTEEAPSAFSAVWHLVKDLAQINAGVCYEQYPIYCVNTGESTLHPGDANPTHTETWKRQTPRHKILEALWRCCYYVCEKYLNSSSDSLDFGNDPTIVNLVSNLCSQLRLQPVAQPLSPNLRASLNPMFRSAGLLTNSSTPPVPPPRGLIGSNKRKGILPRLLTEVNDLWELRENLRSQCHNQEAELLPFSACEGDDIWYFTDSTCDRGTPGVVLEVYRCYERTYIDDLENVLASLKALLFHIIDESRCCRVAKSTMSQSDPKGGIINEFLLCWSICESLKVLTYRSCETQEGWMTYCLQKDLQTGAFERETSYSATGLIAWELNPWGTRHTVPRQNKGKAPQPTHGGDGQAVATAPQRTDWASLLRSAISLSVEPEMPPTTKSSSSSEYDGCDCPVLDPLDLEDLHSIRIRILLRAAAVKDGWHPQYGVGLAEFVRGRMSSTSFGRTGKQKQLFTNYRNAILNPTYNLKTRGDKAAHEATAVQIKRAVEWKTAAGKHKFLRDLFQVIVGMDVEDVGDETDEVIVG